MDNSSYAECDGPFQLPQALAAATQAMINEYERLYAQCKKLEDENAALRAEVEQLKNDAWSSRVTYENVVDQIASLEDASMRDNARRLIEPLLKRTQVTQLRRDIKKRVKELNEAYEPAPAPGIMIEHAEVMVQSAGNNIAHTINTTKEQL